MWVLNSNNCRVFYLMKANGCKTIKTISMIMAKAGTSSFFKRNTLYDSLSFNDASQQNFKTWQFPAVNQQTSG